jgi:hypothetical protein
MLKRINNRPTLIMTYSKWWVNYDHQYLVLEADRNKERQILLEALVGPLNRSFCLLQGTDGIQLYTLFELRRRVWMSSCRNLTSLVRPLITAIFWVWINKRLKSASKRSIIPPPPWNHKASPILLAGCCHQIGWMESGADQRREDGKSAMGPVCFFFSRLSSCPTKMSWSLDCSKLLTQFFILVI